MPINALDALQRDRLHDSLPAARDERLRSLLQKLLVAARRAQETPLAFEAGVFGIASAAWAEFLGELRPDERRAWRERDALRAGLNHTIATVLDVQPQRRGAPNPQSGDPQTSPRFAASDETAATGTEPFEPTIERELAAWLGRTCALVRGVDSQALEILTLRLEGYDDREARGAKPRRPGAGSFARSRRFSSRTPSSCKMVRSGH